MESTEPLTVTIETSTILNVIIFKLFYLVPTFAIFSLFSFPFFTIIGLLQSFYVLFTGKPNSFLIKFLLKVEHWNLKIITVMLLIQSESFLLEEDIIVTDYDNEPVVSRIESFFRFFAIPMFLLWNLVLYSQLIFISLSSSISILRNKPIEFKYTPLNVKEYFYFLNYLCHATKKRIKWNFANDSVILSVFILLFIDRNLFRMSELLFHNLFYITALYLAIYVFYFLFIIPNYLSFPASVPDSFSGNEIRKQIGIQFPKKTVLDLIIAVLITVFQLALIYVCFLFFLYSTESLFFDPNFLHYYIFRGLYPGITEEILFRGYIFAILKKKFSLNKSILISSFLFGLYHLLLRLPTIGWDNVVQMIHTTFIGVMLCVFRVASNSLIGPIVIHSLYDIVLFSLLLFEPATIPPYFYMVSYLMIITINFLVMLISTYLLKNIYNRPDILSFRNKEAKSQTMSI